MTRPRSLIPYPAQQLPLEMPTVADLDSRDPAVPATPSGLRLGRQLMSRRVSAGLPDGCVYQETADLIAPGRGVTVAQLELWHSPSLASQTRGVRITPDMANCWVLLADGQLVSQDAYRHRGPAIDRLAAACLPSPTPTHPSTHPPIHPPNPNTRQET